MWICFAGKEFDLRRLEAECFGEQSSDGFVRFAFFRGLSDADLQNTVLFAANFIAFASGVGVHTQHNALRMRGKCHNAIVTPRTLLGIGAD